MSVSDLDTRLKAALPGQVFENSAPKGLETYVVWHQYSANLLVGDDVVQDEVPRIQIDVIWQRDNSIYRAVKQVLNECEQVYDLVSIGYDDEWAAMRAILQLEVA